MFWVVLVQFCFRLCELGLRTHLEVGVVEVVGDVPAEHEELAALDQRGVEVGEAEEQLLVAVRAVAARELLLRHQVVQPLDVRLQTLQQQCRIRTGTSRLTRKSNPK